MEKMGELPMRRINWALALIADTEDRGIGQGTLSVADYETQTLRIRSQSNCQTTDRQTQQLPK